MYEQVKKEKKSDKVTEQTNHLTKHELMKNYGKQVKEEYLPPRSYKKANEVSENVLRVASYN